MTHTNYTFNVGITVLSGDTTKLRTPHNSADVVHLNGPTNPHILERRVLLPCPLCAFVVAPDWSQERIACGREISKMLPERAVWPASSTCSDDHSADTRVGFLLPNTVFHDIQDFMEATTLASDAHFTRAGERVSVTCACHVEF